MFACISKHRYGVGVSSYMLVVEVTVLVAGMKPWLTKIAWEQGKPLYVALAQRQDVRKAQLEQQYTVPRVPGMPAGRGAGPNAPNGAPIRHSLGDTPPSASFPQARSKEPVTARVGEPLRHTICYLVSDAM